MSNNIIKNTDDFFKYDELQKAIDNINKEIEKLKEKYESFYEIINRIINQKAKDIEQNNLNYNNLKTDVIKILKELNIINQEKPIHSVNEDYKNGNLNIKNDNMDNNFILDHSKEYEINKIEKNYINKTEPINDDILSDSSIFKNQSLINTNTYKKIFVEKDEKKEKK